MTGKRERKDQSFLFLKPEDGDPMDSYESPTPETIREELARFRQLLTAGEVLPVWAEAQEPMFFQIDGSRLSGIYEALRRYVQQRKYRPSCILIAPDDMQQLEQERQTSSLVPAQDGAGTLTELYETPIAVHDALMTGYIYLGLHGPDITRVE